MPPRHRSAPNPSIIVHSIPEIHGQDSLNSRPTIPLLYYKYNPQFTHSHHIYKQTNKSIHTFLLHLHILNSNGKTFRFVSDFSRHKWKTRHLQKFPKMKLIAISYVKKCKNPSQTLRPQFLYITLSSAVNLYSITVEK